MARERLTQRSKRADDPIQMSRETKNPPVEKYMNGDPSTWAEDVYDKHLWEAENKPGGRTETGHPAAVGQSYGPSVKEAAIKQAKALKAKALKCVRIAESLLPRTTEASLEDQGMDLMELSDRAVEATLSRIAEMDQNEKYQEMKYEKNEKPWTPKDGADVWTPKAGKKKKAESDGVGDADTLADSKMPGMAPEHPAQAREDDDADEGEDDVMKEARALLAKAKKLIADAEGTHAGTDPGTDNKAQAFEEDDEEDEEKKKFPFAKEEDEEACMEEADDDMDEKDMSDLEKAANVLVKKARVLVAAYEGEKRPTVAAVIKKEAQGLLAQAKKILAVEKKAGEDVKDDSVPPTLGGESETKAPVAEKGQDKGVVAKKKAEALQALKAAKKVLADLGMDDGDDKDEEVAKEGELPPALAENAKKMQEAAAEESESDTAGPDLTSGKVDDTEPVDEHPAQAREEEEEAMSKSTAMEGDDDIDMMSGKSDDDVEALFMSPEMEDAKEAYEKAYGLDEDEEEEVAKEEDEEEHKMASKTASKKKGAKTLKAGIKLSSASNSVDELSKLWDCPPDVSHLFK